MMKNDIFQRTADPVDVDPEPWTFVTVNNNDPVDVDPEPW